MAHQIIADHLINKYKKTRKLISPKKRIRRAALAVAAVLTIALSAVFLYRFISGEKVPYDTEKAVAVLENGVEAYRKAGLQHDNLSALLSDLQNAVNKFSGDREAAFYDYDLRLSNLDGIAVDSSREFILPLLTSGNVMEWTQNPLADDEYLELAALADVRKGEYAEIVKALYYTFGQGNPIIISQNINGFFDQLTELMEADAEIAALLYAISCREHVDAMLDALYGSPVKEDRERAALIDAMLSEAASLNAHLPSERDTEALASLLSERKQERASLLSGIKMHEIFRQYVESLPANPPDTDLAPPFIDLTPPSDEDEGAPDDDSSDAPENDSETTVPDGGGNDESENGGSTGGGGNDGSENGGSTDGTEDNDTPVFPDIDQDIFNPSAADIGGAKAA